MDKVDEAIRIVRGEIPPGCFMEKTVRTSGLIEDKDIRRLCGFTLRPGESLCSRQEALKIYNSIRFKLTDIEESSFKEEKDMEWEFEMSFFFADNDNEIE
ncbi:MAG: hypothetical protein JW882_09925 [Deltaproteobacteria bacterium]|nr:hypothetical protein [Deltaproteobacteria bacterium]